MEIDDSAEHIEDEQLWRPDMEYEETETDLTLHSSQEEEEDEEDKPIDASWEGHSPTAEDFPELQGKPIAKKRRHVNRDESGEDEEDEEWHSEEDETAAGSSSDDVEDHAALEHESSNSEDDDDDHLTEILTSAANERPTVFESRVTVHIRVPVSMREKIATNKLVPGIFERMDEDALELLDSESASLIDEEQFVTDSVYAGRLKFRDVFGIPIPDWQPFLAETETACGYITTKITEMYSRDAPILKAQLFPTCLDTTSKKEVQIIPLFLLPDILEYLRPELQGSNHVIDICLATARQWEKRCGRDRGRSEYYELAQLRENINRRCVRLSQNVTSMEQRLASVEREFDILHESHRKLMRDHERYIKVHAECFNRIEAKLFSE